MTDTEIYGHKIPANTNVMVSIHHTHRNPNYFDHPDDFRPNRFSENNKNNSIDHYAWAPFGKGAHLCLGMQFASLEIKAYLYQLVLNYRLNLETDYRLEVKGLPASGPDSDVPVVLTPR